MSFRKNARSRIAGNPWTALGCGALAGVLGTLAMGPVGNVLYQLESEEKKKREEALRKEMPFETLAGRLIELGGVEPTGERKRKLGQVVHWGYGIGWGVLYAVLRKRMPFVRTALGSPFGLFFALVGDEVMNTVMGLTAPPRSWPIEAHARGVAAHLAYAAAAEGACRALDAAAALA